MKKFGIFTIVLSIIIGLLPLVSLLIASLLASLFGCTINESGTSSCPTVFGDVGEVLTMMGLMGWYLFFTVPAGLAGVLVGCIVLIVSAIRKRMKQKKNTSADQTPLQ